VTNRGGRASGQGYISLAVDGRAVAQVPIGVTAPGVTTYHDVSWNATRGRHNLTFTLVVNNGTAEYNNSNDLFVLPLEVSPAPVAAFDTTPMVFLVVALFVGASAVPFLARWWRRRKLSETRK
jgi:hypothetical protein